MPLAAGTRLGPYEIVSPLGAGGMGEVYRGRDTRLNRDVAIKILPPAFAADADRRARFEREAQAVAALNHANILAIFDAGETSGHEPIAYIVTELLAGESLRQRVADGPLPVRKAIEIASQIARGLAAAHERGIIHRDLKPENIFLTSDSQVKILDFGLARSILAGTGATETAAAVTDPGTAMGTVGYMSPEQVRGQQVDVRADLFALGCVLYELLTGQRAFHRETAAETLTAILREEPPDVTAVRSTLSPALDRIVRHCLEKTPSERFQTARDVIFALDALSGSQSSIGIAATHARPRRGTFGWIAAAGLGVAMLVATAAATHRWWPPPPSPEWSGAALGGPEIALRPRISPDGRTLAFTAMVDNLTQLAVMSPDTGDWRIVTTKRNAGFVNHLSWSPDGTSVYFDRIADVALGVYRVNVMGVGDEQLLVEHVQMPTALPDGSLLVVKGSRLVRFWPDSGKEQDLGIDPDLSTASASAAALPGGRDAVVRGVLSSDPKHENHLYLVDLTTGQSRRLVPGDDTRYAAEVGVSPDGASVVAEIASGNLWRIVNLPRSGAGSPRTLLTLSSTLLPPAIDLGSDGSIYAQMSSGSVAALEFGLDGRTAPWGKLILGEQAAPVAELPDGRLIVASVFGGHPHLLLADRGKPPARFINSNEETGAPVTPVGADELACVVGAQRREIGVVNIANGQIVRRIVFAKGAINALSATPDGQTLFVSANNQIWAQPIAGGEPRHVRAGSSAAVDPTGRTLYVQGFDPGKVRLLAIPLAGGAEREVPLSGPYTLTFDPLNSASFSRDGRLVVPISSRDDWFFPVGVIDLASGRISRIPTDHFGDYHFAVWSPEGRIVAWVHEVRSSLWRFQPEAPVK